MVLGVALLLYFVVLRVSPGSSTLLALAAGLAASLNAAVRTWLGWRPERNLLERSAGEEAAAWWAQCIVSSSKAVNYC